MDLFEHDILQKIEISETERLPIEMLESLYASIMVDGAEVDDNNDPAFQALTEEFLQRINTELNTSLTVEDLEELGFPSKSYLEQYGDDLYLACYIFDLNEETYRYQYYLNNRVSKFIAKGTARINCVNICNDNNESIYTGISEWKSKYAVYGEETIYMDDYYKFMNLWEDGQLSEYKYITIKNICDFRHFSGAFNSSE